MALRAPRRLLTAVLAGGLVTGSLLLGAGSALAAPSSDDDVVEARCGQTVRAEPGQTVKVIPELGAPFEREVRAGMEPIRQVVGGIGGLLCRVQVQVVEPVTDEVAEAAPPLRQATEQLSRGTGAVLDPDAETTTTTPPTTETTTPEAPAAPTFTPQQAAAAAPAFAPAFGQLPSSFLRSASGPAPGVATYDPNMLLGSAFPGLRAGAPAYLGYDAASAVTTASQVQALPVDGLTDGGVGVPALIAVLALSGVAAFTVRRIVLGKAVPAATSTGAAAAGEQADEQIDEQIDDVVHAAGPDEDHLEDDVDDLDEGADEEGADDEGADEDAVATSAAPRAPVPA